MESFADDLLSCIRDRQRELSHKKREVAKYILDHPVEAAFLTATELAQRTEVSEPTVVRFAAELGFTGYPELRNGLQRLIQGRLTTVDRLKEYHEHLKSSEDPVIQMLLMDLQNLEETLGQLDLGTVRGVVEEMTKAEKIIIIGSRMSSVLAEFMHMVLKKSLRCEISVVTSQSDLFHEELVHAPEQTLVVGIGFPRYTRLAVDYIELAREEGFRTVVITDSELSPLVEHGDHVLIARYDIISYTDSFTAPFSLVSALGTAVSLKIAPDNIDKLERLERMWKDHQVFY